MVLTACKVRFGHAKKFFLHIPQRELYKCKQIQVRSLTYSAVLVVLKFFPEIT